MEFKLRILNKSKDGVVLTSMSKQQNVEPKFFTWAEFNALYEISENKHVAVMKKEHVEEFKAKMEQADEIITDITLSVMIANGPGFDAVTKMAHLSTLHERVEKLAGILKCDYTTALSVVQTRFNAVMDDFGSPKHEKKETPQEYKARKERERQTVPTTRATSSLGDLDALKNLKNSFKK